VTSEPYSYDCARAKRKDENLDNRFRKSPSPTQKNEEGGWKKKGRLEKTGPGRFTVCCHARGGSKKKRRGKRYCPQSSTGGSINGCHPVTPAKKKELKTNNHGTGKVMAYDRRLGQIGPTVINGDKHSLGREGGRKRKVRKR